MSKKLFLCILIVSLLVTSLPLVAFAGTLTASGTQIKGVPGRSNVLQAEPFSLPANATITAVNCNVKGGGFWIEGYSTMRSGEWNLWEPANRAIGVVVGKGGPYRLYPTIPAGAERASCSATFTW
jgi:hypothetical protein